MANTTSKHALNIHGTNPQFLIEKIIRSRIYDSVYWKEHCFALTSSTIIDKTINLNSIGGTFEAQKITPFLCLLCKLLQIQPEKEILLEYLKFEEFKYLRALAAMYVRMTFKSIEVYEILEPMLNDYRKLRYRGMDGSYSILHLDEFIDQLLTQDRVCDITLPRLTKREVLEETENLTERISLLEEILIGENNNSNSLNSDEERKKKRRKKNVDGEDESSNGSGSESDESQDSFILEIKSKIKKNERIKRIKENENEKENDEKMDLDENEKKEIVDEDELEGYTSQEYSDQEGDEEKGRYVSRSPSRSVSPNSEDERKGRSGGSERFVSKSPSRSVSPDRIQSTVNSDVEMIENQRFVSKSPSKSP